MFFLYELNISKLLFDLSVKISNISNTPNIPNITEKYLILKSKSPSQAARTSVLANIHFDFHSQVCS